MLQDDLSCLTMLTKKKLLQKVQEAAQREPNMIYIYYTGHSDTEGNWSPDGMSHIGLDDVIKTLKDSQYTGKVFITVDCSYAGHWVKQAVRECQRDRRYLEQFAVFNLKALYDAE